MKTQNKMKRAKEIVTAFIDSGYWTINPNQTLSEQIKNLSSLKKFNFWQRRAIIKEVIEVYDERTRRTINERKNLQNLRQGVKT